MKSTTAHLHSQRSIFAMTCGLMGFQPMVQPDLFTEGPPPSKPAPQTKSEETDIPYREKHRKGRDGSPLHED